MRDLDGIHAREAARIVDNFKNGKTDFNAAVKALQEVRFTKEKAEKLLLTV